MGATMGNYISLVIRGKLDTFLIALLRKFRPTILKQKSTLIHREAESVQSRWFRMFST